MSTDSSNTNRHTANPADVRNRSRASGFELLKTTVALASAGVGAFFFGLLNDFEGVVGAEYGLLVATVVFLVLAVLAGLLAWGADAAFYKYWADVLVGKDGSSWEARDRMKRWRGRLIVVMVGCFSAGVLTAGAFALSRAA